MARSDEKKHGLTPAYSPILENDGSDDLAAVQETGCLGRLCCFGWKQGNTNQESKFLLQGDKNRGEEESWVSKKFKKLKEFSEVIAGPKWKNLIRKIGKYCNPKKSRTQQQHMYSPQSYALNFDDGEEDEDDDLFLNFSSRFSAPLTSSTTDRPQRKGNGL
ncbi:hypothetical protein M9H77_14821 [Catharanthus roseus]|uniref:Uncharacterized protein n=1 Tax=Catharanthus roseus TaxID=4058 RepID=A0ACC0BPE6_CATRO|nr:hypothetical protein M9H77_14821 [Catharanthus roseus]